ncbi:MAG: hypothetical protein KDC38_10420, partial [Planctomycetes bacterium]|nr:hypothetical protein [Planctomycetota bacterium]
LDTEYLTWGWSYGLCHPMGAYELVSAQPGATDLVIQGGSPPDFEELEVHPGGMTHGVVIDLLGHFSLAPGSDYELSIAHYDAVDPQPGQVCFCEILGTPPYSVVVVVSDASVVPTQICGDFQLSPDFIRGDCDRNAVVDISDPIHLLQYLFAGGHIGGCEDSCDVNDDGTLNIGDGVQLLNALFAGGTLPAAPYPGCGSDPTGDVLGCTPVDACP